MARKLVGIESQNFEGFEYSECQWLFKPSIPLIGKSLDEISRLTRLNATSSSSQMSARSFQSKHR